jgi:integrase
MRKKISKSSVDAAEATTKELILWDSLLPGFCVRVRPSGRKFYWCKFRINGKQRWKQLGEHGPMTPTQARREAKVVLDSVARGLDPSGRGEGDVVTVEDLCKRFMEAHGPDLKDRTSGEYQRWIDNHIVPALGKLPLAEVNHKDIEAFHRSLRNKRTTANRCLAVLSSMFAWADVQGLREADNPCRKVKRFKEQAKERFLTNSERQRLFDVLDKHQDAEPYVVAAIRLLAYTGCRKNEILTLQWDHVDFENKCLRLPDTKTGKRKVVLNAPALAVLSSLGRVDGNPHVIVGRHGKGHLIGLQRPWDRIRREAELPDLRVHDLRHSVASWGVAAGLSLPQIGGLLGHRSSATTAKYAHLADDVLRQAAEAVGDMATGNGKKVKQGGR